MWGYLLPHLGLDTVERCESCICVATSWQKDLATVAVLTLWHNALASGACETQHGPRTGESLQKGLQINQSCNSRVDQHTALQWDPFPCRRPIEPAKDVSHLAENDLSVWADGVTAKQGALRGPRLGRTDPCVHMHMSRCDEEKHQGRILSTDRKGEPRSPQS